MRQRKAARIGLARAGSAPGGGVIGRVGARRCRERRGGEQGERVAAGGHGRLQWFKIELKDSSTLNYKSSQALPLLPGRPEGEGRNPGAYVAIVVPGFRIALRAPANDLSAARGDALRSNLTQALDRPARQFVGAVVHDIVAVALDPFPGHLVAGVGCVEPPPEVFVFHRLLVGGFPAVLLPAVNPFGERRPSRIWNRCAAARRSVSSAR